MMKLESSVVVVVIALLCFVNTSWCQDTMNNEDTNMTGGFEQLKSVKRAV